VAHITFLAPDTDAYVASVQRHVTEYEQASGDSVDIEIMDTDRYFSNDIQHRLAATEPIDVFMSGPVLLWQHVGAGLVEPLDSYLASASAGYDFADFFPSLIEANRWTGAFGSPLGVGPLLEIPVNCESYNLAFNEAVLAELGMEPPTTWDEYFAMAREITARTGGRTHGFAQRGADVWHTMYTGYATQFWSQGARDFDENGACAIASAAGIEATSQFIAALRDAGPTDWTDQRWYELALDFGKGDYGLIVDSDHYVAFFEDPGLSSIPGGVGYRLPPVGATGIASPNLWTWSLAMNAKSQNKSAAWAFIEWASGRDFLLRSAFEGNMNPTRRSTWADAAFSERLRPWGRFREVALELIENRAHVLITPAVNYLEIGHRWAQALRAAYLGGDIAVELRAAAHDIDELVAAGQRSTERGTQPRG
jgi:multiple sugar transport system substrate-binding protein